MSMDAQPDRLLKVVGVAMALGRRHMGQADAREFREVAVDTTVQEKAIAHPTDARLYDTARSKLVDLARTKGITLRQSYARKGPEALRKHGRSCHAK